MQIALSRNLNLSELCGVNAVFAVFCELFAEASFTMAYRAFASSDGFGVQVAFSGTLELANGFDIAEDLIGWPDDNQVSVSLDLRLVNKKFKTCVEFQDNEFCTGKCEGDADCDEDQACDNVFKVCREKRNNGGKCGRDAGCKSDICLAGWCRECRYVTCAILLCFDQCIRLYMYHLCSYPHIIFISSYLL